KPTRCCSPSLPMSMPAEACFSTTWLTALSISAAISAASNFSPASWRTSRSDNFSLRGRLPTWVVRMRSRLKIMRDGSYWPTLRQLTALCIIRPKPGGNTMSVADARATTTYGQLADRVARFGAVLRSLGIQREERVLLALTDTVDWPTAFLGCLKTGVIAVPVNTLLTEDDYRFMLADSRAKCLVVSEALFPKFEKLVGEAKDLEHVVVSGDNAHNHKRFEDLLNTAKPEPYTAPTTCDDMAF